MGIDSRKEEMASSSNGGRRESDDNIDIDDGSGGQKENDSMIVGIINKAVWCATHLSNLLPTGTVLIFQMLSPLLTEGGSCGNGLPDKLMTAILLSCCGLSCFLLSLTDTYISPDGTAYYGIATSKGLYIPQLSGSSPPPNTSSYRLTPLDFIHATLSTLIFATSTLFSPYIQSCFYPSIPKPLQTNLPFVAAFLVSFLFLLFPSHRRQFDSPPQSPSSSSTTTTTSN